MDDTIYILVKLILLGGFIVTEKMFSNRDLKKLIIPLIIEQVLMMLVGIVDTMMISTAGEASISGVALVDMVNFLIITILSALATGGAIVVSQYLGGKDKENASFTASQLITVTALLSLALTALSISLHKYILTALFGSVDSDVMKAATTYFLITAASFPFIGIYSSSAAVFRSMNKTNVTMNVTIGMNIINVIGNALGIYALRAGVAGVAVPTLISRIFAGILMTALAFNKNNPVYVTVKNIMSWNKVMIGRILRIAIPNGVENGLFMFGKVLVTSIVALFGTSQIAANGVSHSVNMVAIIVVSAVNLAIVTVIGQCVGAKEYDQAKYYLKKLMTLSYLSTGALTVLVAIMMPLKRKTSTHYICRTRWFSRCCPHSHRLRANLSAPTSSGVSAMPLRTAMCRFSTADC